MFVCALTYRDSSSHHKKTITTIFLVMRFSAGTRGYGTHIQTSHDMTHPTKQRLQVCSWCQWHYVSDTKSNHIPEKISESNYTFPLRYKIVKICFRRTTGTVSPNVLSVIVKRKEKQETRKQLLLCRFMSASHSLQTGTRKINPRCPLRIGFWLKKCQSMAAHSSNVNPQEDVLEQFSQSVWLRLCRAAC